MTLREFVSLFTNTDNGFSIQVGDEPMVSKYLAPFDNWYSFYSGHVELGDDHNDELLDHEVVSTCIYETPRVPETDYASSTYLVVTVEA